MRIAKSALSCVVVGIALPAVLASCSSSAANNPPSSPAPTASTPPSTSAPISTTAPSAAADAYTSADLRALLPCTGTKLPPPMAATFGAARDTGECAQVGVTSAVNIIEFATYADATSRDAGVAKVTPLGTADVKILTGSNWVALVPASGFAAAQQAVGGQAVS